MSTYNNNNIDGMAVGLLQAYVNASNSLEGNFNYNDKELLWDGDIKVYSDNKKHSIDTFMDRIPVQIKGHEVARYKGNSCKYPVPLENLKKYQQDGGVIYFEVELKNNTNYRLYYKILLPANIKNYLKSAKGEKSITIKFDKLDNCNPNQIKYICNFFIKQKEKQVGKTILDIKDFKNIENITIEGLSINGIKNFFDDEKFFYTKINGEIQPINLPNDITIQRPIQGQVSVDGKVYYDNFVIKQSSNKLNIFEFGKCLSIEENKRKKQYTINIISDYNTIQQILNEKDFIVTFLEKHTIEINTEPLINIQEKEFTQFSESIKNVIEETETIAKVLNYLGLKLDIPYSSITSEQKGIIKRINNIINGDIKGNDVGFKYINIGTNKVLILLCSNHKQEQRCFNVFSDKIFETYSFHTTIEGIGKLITSPYFIIGAENIATASNFEPEPVINNILSIQFHSEIVTIAINFLLDLLIEYDKSNDRRLLEVAEAFYKNDCIMNSGISMIINKYQILKRMRELSDEEKEELIQLKINNEDKYEVLCCVNLLIDNVAEFEYYFKKLNKDEQERFLNYPIIKFYPNDVSKLIE